MMMNLVFEDPLIVMQLNEPNYWKLLNEANLKLAGLLPKEASLMTSSMKA